jgi:hypothetical protein
MDPIRDILGWTAAVCGALILVALTAALCGLLGLFVLSRYRKLATTPKEPPQEPEDPFPYVPPGGYYVKTTTTETPLAPQKEEFSCACGGELKIAKVEATDGGVVTTHRCEKCGREFTS